MKTLEELLRTMLEGIVCQPHEISIEQTFDPHRGLHGGTVFIVHLASDDMGKAIGKRGRIADSMRTILKSCAKKHNIRVYLEIRV